MKIKLEQFLFGKLHSWSIVGQNIGRSLLKLGHEVHFVSTDGFENKFCPTDLLPHVRKHPEGMYDCQISYTAPHNWGTYLAHGKKNTFAIWAYEYNSKNKKQTLLSGFGKHAMRCTKVLAPSNFVKEVFINMGIPEEKQVVIPHGIDFAAFESKSKYKLKTDKSKKILLNIAQPHKRKALNLALESYGKAFTKEDDVVLIAKVSAANKGNSAFDVDFNKMLKDFKLKYKNHAEIILIQDYIPNIVELYNACDINFSSAHCEGYWIPGAEGMVAGLINVAPNYGGLLDFCNTDNSLLIDGTITAADRSHQYWSHNPFAVHFKINTDDAAQKLRTAVNDYDVLKAKLIPNMKTNIISWDAVAEKILGLCE